jgi:three-Cys-motif partner protein
MRKSGPIWPIEPHTEAKHAILKKYLDAWLPIITKWNGRVLYIDGFAGPGEYVGGQDGSPIIAIKAVTEHKATIKAEIIMLFIEEDKSRHQFLEQKLAHMKLPPNVKPRCICARFDATLGEILARLDEQKKALAPAFVFIDPFGFSGIPLSLIKRIMGNRKCEVLITFMYEEVNRFLGSQALRNSLDETFGTSEWQDIQKESDPQTRELKLHGLYKRQLEGAAGIGIVRSFKMTNKMNKTDYFLFFGTNNIEGLRKMKAAMWKVDPIGSFQFSDATYKPGQPTLFDLEPNYASLKRTLVQRFKGQSVSIPELENFILLQTPFRETHYKRQILAPMEKSEDIAITCRGDGKRKKGTFPVYCIIKFL